MAFWCVDSVGGNDGTGSSQTTQSAAEGTPYLTLAAISEAASDTVLLKADSTFLEQHTMVNGVDGSPTIYGMYAYGAIPIIDGEDTRSYGLVKNGAQYITVKEMHFQDQTGAGVRFGQDATGTGTLNDTKCYRVSQENAVNGLVWTAVGGDAVIPQATGILAEDCIANNNQQHGILCSCGWDGAIYRRCSADGNGISLNGWGLYMAPRAQKYNADDWVLVSGTIYERTRADLDLKLEHHVTVVADGRTNAVEGSAEYWLTEGTFDAIADGEWAQSADEITFQINIGQDPANKSISYANGIGENGLMEQCTASNQSPVEDGVGIGFDHGVRNSIVRNCTSVDNVHGYSLNIPDGCRIEFSSALNSSGDSFRCNTPKPGAVTVFQGDQSTNPGGQDYDFTRYLNTGRVLILDPQDSYSDVEMDGGDNAKIYSNSTYTNIDPEI
jgi:hypothetical protein